MAEVNNEVILDIKINYDAALDGIEDVKNEIKKLEADVPHARGDEPRTIAAQSSRL